MPHVVVIGAGAIGLCAARTLRARGWDVTVFDAAHPGAGASHGNAGWVVPALSDPVPAPGLIGQSLRWMLRPASPLYIRPRPDPALARWLFAFWRNCTARAFTAGLEATAALNTHTFALYDDLERDGIDAQQERRGLIAAYHAPRALAHDLRAMERLVAFGQPAPIPLDGDAIRRLEPALGPAVTGGIHLPAERHLRPDRLCAALATWLEAHGVTVRSQTPVAAIRHARGKVSAVETRSGPIAADAVLIAAGAWTPQLTNLVGVRLPIQAGKGYSIDHTPSPIPITHPIYLHESRVAITPFTDAVRFSGTMELAGLDPQIRPTRVAAITASAARSLADWPASRSAPPDRASSAPDTPRPWAGFRPLTPDGLPVIGRLPGFANLLVASGHAMLGITLAPATAEAVADLLEHDPTVIPTQLRPFDPARFARPR